LPRPSKLEIAGVLAGVVVMIVGAALSGGDHGAWPQVMLFIGAVIAGISARRAAGRRLDAIRSRPPM
jgi:hypothetical protein